MWLFTPKSTALMKRLEIWQIGWNVGHRKHDERKWCKSYVAARLSCIRIPSRMTHFELKTTNNSPLWRGFDYVTRHEKICQVRTTFLETQPKPAVRHGMPFYLWQSCQQKQLVPTRQYKNIQERWKLMKLKVLISLQNILSAKIWLQPNSQTSEWGKLLMAKVEFGEFTPHSFGNQSRDLISVIKEVISW